MYITFDYKCPACDEVEPRFVRREEMDVQHCNTCNLDQPMIRLPAGTRTTFRYADTKLKE